MFRVTWDKTAGGAWDTMQQLILDHPDRVVEFGDMLRDLDRFLERVPYTLGEPDAVGDRVYFIHPVTVRFRIFGAERRVHIMQVELG